jgi:hypothetical protein
MWIFILCKNPEKLVEKYPHTKKLCQKNWSFGYFLTHLYLVQKLADFGIFIIFYVGFWWGNYLDLGPILEFWHGYVSWSFRRPWWREFNSICIVELSEVFENSFFVKLIFLEKILNILS